MPSPFAVLENIELQKQSLFFIWWGIEFKFEWYILKKNTRDEFHDVCRFCEWIEGSKTWWIQPVYCVLCESVKVPNQHTRPVVQHVKLFWHKYWCSVRLRNMIQVLWEVGYNTLYSVLQIKTIGIKDRLQWTKANAKNASSTKLFLIAANNIEKKAKTFGFDFALSTTIKTIGNVVNSH